MKQDGPAWKAKDPSGSLRRQAAWLSEKARETFLTDGFHTELFFLYRADGQGAIAQPPPNVDRDAFVAQLKRGIKQHQIFGIIHMVEAWTYFPRRPADHTMRQIMEGEIAVSELNKGDRTEALMVRCEGRDGYSMLWLSPIIRTPTGVALADAMEMPDMPEGRFADLFKG